MKNHMKFIIVVLPLSLLSGCFKSPTVEVSEPPKSKEIKVCDEECEKKRHDHFHSGKLPDPSKARGY